MVHDSPVVTKLFCIEHRVLAFQVKDMEKRISRVERFILGAFVFCTISFVTTTVYLRSLPQAIVDYQNAKITDTQK